MLDDINVGLVNLVLKSCTEEVGGPVTYGGHYEYNDKIANIVEQLATQLKDGVTDDKATNCTMWGTLCSLSEAGNTLYSVPEICVVIPGSEDGWGPKIEIMAGTSVDWTGGIVGHAVANIQKIVIYQAVHAIESEDKTKEAKSWEQLLDNITDVSNKIVDEDANNGATERTILYTAASIVIGGGPGAIVSGVGVVDSVVSSAQQEERFKEILQNDNEAKQTIIKEARATDNWVTIIGGGNNIMIAIGITDEGDIHEITK